MLKHDNLYLAEEARPKMMEGIKRAAHAVGITLGTSGANSILETIYSPRFYVSNDGASILESIVFSDPLQELGRKILVEAVGRANKANGDGSSTATVLTAAILEEGIKHIGEVAPMEIKRSLEACLPLIEQSLKSQRKELIDKDGKIDLNLLEQCASISAEDEEIGKMVAEMYSKIGKDGICTWEASKDVKDSYTIGTGIRIDGATYMSRYMCDSVGNDFAYQATIENPLILLAQTKITSVDEMQPFVGLLIENGVKDLVIFCDEMNQPIMNSFIMARAPQAAGIRFVVVKMPVVFNDLWWEDLERASGGRIISPTSGIKLRDIKMEHLGKFGKITVMRDETIIDGIADMTSYLMALKVDGSDEALARVARLKTKTARYYVGGHSESGLAYRRLKVEDAINSAWCAMQNGIVPGGGIALRNAGYCLPNETSVGAAILLNALDAPFYTILKNCGSPIQEDGVLNEDIEGEEGVDSKTGKKVDSMFEAGIVDSFDVVMGAVRNAVGVASGVLTCGTVVLLPRPENSVDEAIKGLLQNPQ